MKLSASDPDIQTLAARIGSGDLDLQPDFQRGEVWSENKKRRLIDTILRDWHVPPIHVIEIEGGDAEVLDGQQRLVAIRDFVAGTIRVDGKIEPIDTEIFAADNFTYDQLPSRLRKRFDTFPIRVLKITDYKPEEPPELFYRLNQPTSLTAAEQRNAFFGPVRLQIRGLVKSMPKLGLGEDVIGFSNSRMGYDDTIAKVCLCVEIGTLHEKATANAITDRYRRGESFNTRTVDVVRDSLHLMGVAVYRAGFRPRFNKATLFSWLCFLSRVVLTVRANHDVEELLGRYFEFFEVTRARAKDYLAELTFPGTRVLDISDAADQALSVYNDRASARVADISSVLARDLVLSLLFTHFACENGCREMVEGTPFRRLLPYVYNFAQSDRKFGEDAIAGVIIAEHWGSLP